MPGKALIAALLAAWPLLAAAGFAQGLWEGREGCAAPASPAAQNSVRAAGFARGARGERGVCAAPASPAAQNSVRAAGFASMRLQPASERGGPMAQISYHFSAVALEAMQKGLPLQVLFEVRRVRPRFAGFDETVARLASRRHIEYHPLSQQYLLRDLASGRRSTHLTLPLAIEALGQYDLQDLPPAPDTRLLARTWLDLETLPAPMRPLAYLSGDWNLDSGWLPLEAAP